jgi:hypothetical protein
MQNNGLLEMIEERIHFTTTFWPNSDIKKKHIFDVYQRNVINWNLQCEFDGFSRKEAFEQFSKRFTTEINRPNPMGYCITGLCIML